MKILLIDDDSVDRSLTKQVLSDAFFDITIVEISDQEIFERSLLLADFDLIISEYRLHWTDGLKLFRLIRDRYACVPFIMLTDSGNEEIAVAAIKAGVDDYLLKKNRFRLNDTVSQCLNKEPGKKICHITDKTALLCEKWDLAISRLTSDFAYSMRISDNGSHVFEWFTEPLKNFTQSNQPLHDNGLPVHPDDNEIVQHHFDKLLAGFENIAEYRVISNNGKIHFFNDHALPIRDWSEGKVVRVYGAIQDITHQRQAEDKLYLMQRAIDSSNNGIIITELQDQDYVIIYANRSFVRMTGYAMDELLGRNPRFLQKDDNKQPGIKTLRAALDDNRDAHTVVRNYRKDGSLFWNEVYVSPVHNKHHKIIHYIGVQNDITRRVEMEQLVRNNEVKMRTIFNNVMDGIIIADNTGIIESLNPSSEAMFGYSIKELQGQPVEQLISTDKSQQFRLKADQMFDRQIEAWGVKKDGTTFPVKIGISNINFDHIALLILTIQNISDSKQAENALRKLSSHLELAREEERSLIAREIHDELGSKLTALKMDLSWLSDKLQDLTLTYLHKTTAMHQHIDDAILTVNKIATNLRPSILDHLGLSAAVEWQVENFKQQSELECHLTMPDQPIEIDEQRATTVFRIIQESLTNINRHAHASQVDINIRSIDNMLSLSITDNGCGMTAIQMNNPEKFGIQGMHERAKHFGGKLSISTHPGEGCTVILNLPQQSIADRHHD